MSSRTSRLIDEQPVRGDVDAAVLCRAMREPAPERVPGSSRCSTALFDEWIPRYLQHGEPGLSRVHPERRRVSRALADLISNGVNRYTGVWRAAPALVQLEANALDWLRDWMQFPASTRGVFTTGGSTANFDCDRLRARAQAGHRHPTRGHVRLDAGASLRHQVRAARGRDAGSGPRDSGRRFSVPHARRCARGRDPSRPGGGAESLPGRLVCRHDQHRRGRSPPRRSPTCAVAGALWHHVDGAYGAFFHICPELRPLLAGLPRADSLTLDPHKGLFLPYGTGALLVADGEVLRARTLGDGELHARQPGRCRSLRPASVRCRTCHAASRGCASGWRSSCTARRVIARRSPRSARWRSPLRN